MFITLLFVTFLAWNNMKTIENAQKWNVRNFTQEDFHAGINTDTLLLIEY